MLPRRTLLRSLFGVSGAGLVSLATGLPLSFLRQPLAYAADDDTSITPGRAQYLILSGRDKGDPLNANAPGTYDDPNIIHAVDPSMAKTELRLGPVLTSAAQVWTGLPQWVLDRTSFLHHATKTLVHGHLVKVLQLFGDSRLAETIPSSFAQHLGASLGCTSSTPVPVGEVNFTAQGRTLPQLKPTTLRELLVTDSSPLVTLNTLRQQSLDEINTVLRAHGTVDQRKFLDTHARARADVQALSDAAYDLLGTIRNDSPNAQMRAAVALVKLNLTPVVAVAIPFGGDNHSDEALADEVEEHGVGVAAIAELMALLAAQGLQDKVTFASLNVFGRTLAAQGPDGRDHWSRHHVSMLIGRYVQPSVIGGVAPGHGDYEAQPFSSSTGLPDASGDVGYDDGLPAVAKTIGAAVGMSAAALDQEILRGKVITAAVPG